MSLVVAIQPDSFGEPIGSDRCDTSAPRWAEVLAQAGHRVRWVNVYSADILEQVKDCHGFMWRWAHFGNMRRIAQRLLPVLERDLGMVVYPDQNTCWHYDDKLAQRYLLEARGIPIPQTWIWYDPNLAADWAKTARYPLVLKLAGGAGSSNVCLIRSPREAKLWIKRLFRKGVLTLQEPQRSVAELRRRLSLAVRRVLSGDSPFRDPVDSVRQKGYVLFQEFLSENAFDTRVTVIGNRAFAFRRFNRPNDFRASGSGRLDLDPKGVAPEAISLAFRVARQLSTQSVAVDIIQRHHRPVVAEVSYTYVSWTVHACPGHWELRNGNEEGEIVWRDGQVWPEEAQIADFLVRLECPHVG